MSESAPAVRVALDLVGGGKPAAVAQGATAALFADRAVRLSVVGPSELASTLLAAAPADRWSLTEAAGVVGEDADEAAALRRIRGRRNAACRVATRLVRDGAADVYVSAAPLAVTSAAASFGLGLLPGATQPSLAAAVTIGPDAPGGGAPSAVVIDAGAGADGDAAALVVHAVQGSAYVSSLGRRDVRVALLAGSNEVGRLDRARRRAYDALEAAAAQGLIWFVGPVTIAQLLAGAPIDLVVTDGFTGSVMRAALGARGAEGASGGDALLLGFAAAVVVATPDAPSVTRAIAHAAAAHRCGTVTRVGTALEQLIAQRRSAAGLP